MTVPDKRIIDKRDRPKTETLSCCQKNIKIGKDGRNYSPHIPLKKTGDVLSKYLQILSILRAFKALYHGLLAIISYLKRIGPDLEKVTYKATVLCQEKRGVERPFIRRVT